MKHLIRIESTPHGVLGVRHAGLDQQYCEAGELVILKWRPDAKWGLQEAHYTDGGGNVTAIDLTRVKVDGVNVVAFVMPNANITIGGTFKRFVIQDWTEGTNPSKGEVLTVGNNGEPTPIPVNELANEIAEGDNDLVDAIDRINPFKGWWPDLATLKAAVTATAGDSAYVKDASPATTWSIYVYDSTASSDNYWADSGTDADTSNVQTFASSQEVNEVYIVNDLTTGGTTDVLSAEQGVVLDDKVSQLGHEINANNKDYQDISGLVINGNVGYIKASNGSIASGTSYPTSRYTNPIHLYPGDVVYIKANIDATAVAVFTECDSAGDNRKVITSGVGSVAEYRYVSTKETYIIISTYKVAYVSSGVWRKLSNNTASVLLNTAMVYNRQFEKLGNNIWTTNPTGNPATLDNIQSNTEITRRMVYSCIRWAQFTGLDKTIKRTIYVLWNGYSDYFRVAISKYDTDAAQWVSEFDTNNIDVNTINPNHNAVIPVSIGNTVKLLVDTSLFGYHTFSTIINPLGTSEPEFIFSDACYKESQNVVVNALKTTTPRIYPNALLPCISFEFDDNADNDELVVELFDELGLKCNFAFIASEANITTYGDKYLDWHRRGYGICSHSVDSTIFNTTNYTTETALAALQTSKNRLQNKGFVVNGFVAPSSQMADEFLGLVKETYGYGFTSNDGYSGLRIGNPCRQSRQSMESGTLSYVKGRIDVAIAFGYNFTFYGHSANFGTTYSGEEWNIAKLRAILEYAIAKRDAGQLFIGNSDECMDYFYGDNLYNEHISGACGTIQPKNRHHYYLHNVTSATIGYNANLPAECEFLIETDSSYTSGITFGSGYKFNSVPTFGAGETWHIKIVQGCVIATKMI